MNRTHTALATIAALAGSVLAAPPAALDFVPDSAPFVISIKSVQELVDDLNRFNNSLGEMARPELGMASMMLTGMPGLDTAGSAAIVYTGEIKPEIEPSPEQFTAILPVTDYEALLTALNGQEANGLAQIDFNGSPAFIRKLSDTHVAGAATAEALQAFTQGGFMEAHAARLGDNGSDAASTSDISFILDVASVRPIIEQGLAQLRAEIDAETINAMIAQAGADAGEIDIEGIINKGLSVIENWSTQGSIGMLAINLDEVGMSFNIATQFNEGSELAGIFSNDADPAQALNRVPDQPFIAAFASDLSGEGLQQIVGEFAGLYETLAKLQEAAGTPAASPASVAKLLTSSTAYAQVIAAPQGGLQQGLFSNVTSYMQTTDVEGFKDAYAQMIEIAGAADQGQPGFTAESSYQAAAAEIDGVSLDAYSSTFALDPTLMGQAGPGAAMIMPMLLGPNMGPKGYIFSVGNAVVSTTVQDEATVKQAIAAARQGNGLGSNPFIQQAAAQLPDDCFIQGFFGATDVANAVGPMLMMFGAVDDFQPIEASVPIAFGISGEAGGVQIKTFIPMSLIETAMELAPQAADMMPAPDGDPEF